MVNTNIIEAQQILKILGIGCINRWSIKTQGEHPEQIIHSYHKLIARTDRTQKLLSWLYALTAVPFIWIAFVSQKPSSIFLGFLVTMTCAIYVSLLINSLRKREGREIAKLDERLASFVSAFGQFDACGCFIGLIDPIQHSGVTVAAHRLVEELISLEKASEERVLREGNGHRVDPALDEHRKKCNNFFFQAEMFGFSLDRKAITASLTDKKVKKV